jgi:hypothetical protein
MEFMSQYDCKILYIKGEDNSVADALSRTDFDGEPTGAEPWSCDPTAIASVTVPTDSPFHAAKSLAYTRIKADRSAPATIASVLRVTSDTKILDQIRDGYNTDPWCAKLLSASKGCVGLEFREPEHLWYVGDRLIIPRSGTLRETLFQLAHDSLGHFGFDKSYKSLRDTYYWPNMCSDLEKAYIPGCHDCQKNKSRTKPKAGPLHPLPIPDQRGDSVAIDFIGPLPKDQGHDCIVTFTDRLGSDIQIIETHMKITAPELALLFFKHWYCENGLPLEIISDRDKLFVSTFWKSLHKLTGVRLKMSTAFHPQTDGSSK